MSSPATRWSGLHIQCLTFPVIFTFLHSTCPLLIFAIFATQPSALPLAISSNSLRGYPDNPGRLGRGLGKLQLWSSGKRYIGKSFMVKMVMRLFP